MSLRMVPVLPPVRSAILSGLPVAAGRRAPGAAELRRTRRGPALVPRPVRSAVLSRLLVGAEAFPRVQPEGDA